MESNSIMKEKLDEDEVTAALQGMKMMQKTIYKQLSTIYLGFDPKEWGLSDKLEDSEDGDGGPTS